MRYRIEIWIIGHCNAYFESDSIDDILQYYNDNYRSLFEYGGCAFDIYDNGRLLTFKEEYDLGFHGK